MTVLDSPVSTVSQHNDYLWTVIWPFCPRQTVCLPYQTVDVLNLHFIHHVQCVSLVLQQLAGAQFSALFVRLSLIYHLSERKCIHFMRRNKQVFIVEVWRTNALFCPLVIKLKICVHYITAKKKAESINKVTLLCNFDCEWSSLTDGLTVGKKIIFSVDKGHFLTYC